MLLGGGSAYLTGLSMALTAKQQRFVAEYLRTNNQTQSAIAAGYKSPEVEGSRLLKNAKVAAAVAAGQADRAKRTNINLDYVVQRLAVEAELSADDGGTQSGRVAALRELRQHFTAGGSTGDEKPEPMVFNINVNAPVGDVRVTKPE